jgi:hypothetical protein
MLTLSERRTFYEYSLLSSRGTNHLIPPSLFTRRVHVSNVTLDCLNGAFEVEKAGGEKREEALRQAGLTTYFIIKAVVRPVSQMNQQRSKEFIYP